MSTTTTFDHSGSATTIAAPRKTFFQRIIEARSRKGAAVVRHQLCRMSDQQLGSLGFSTKQIETIRVTGRVPNDFWL